MTSGDSWITVSQASQHAGVRSSVVRRWVEEGLVESKVVGQCRMVSFLDIQRIARREKGR